MQDIISEINKKAAEFRNQSATLREGQSLMVALHIVKPDWYRIIIQTKSDCFYQDDKISNFWDKIAELQS